MNEIGANRYGKQKVRLVKVVRGPKEHHVRDLTVGIKLEGAFAEAHTTGSNALVVTTDTMKNTAYALAPEHLGGAIETYGSVLARHFLRDEQVTRASVTIAEHRWIRLDGAAGPAPDAFRRAGDFTRTAAVSATRDGVTVEAGIEDLSVMKTSRSAFHGFPRDEFTTLKEVDDRILATKVTATWRYASGASLDHDAVHADVVGTLLEVFADHMSLSAQQSIWLMGDAILRRRPEIEEVSMVLPNLHHWVVDFTPFGRRNDGEIFVATNEPHGQIEATVRRSGR